MAGYESNAAPSAGGANVGVDVMEVIMRGLQTARQDLTNEGEGGEEAGIFCGFAYGSPGTFCPLAYWHSDAIVEEAMPSE
ncbi:MULTISPECIES: hypothetical protein [unclassified Knoellia]|uniref:hypothetical protein n=1 Tax=Knoellia altitudinis TaxID=3404795 RepID=UPI0036212790